MYVDSCNAFGTLTIESIRSPDDISLRSSPEDIYIYMQTNLLDFFYEKNLSIYLFILRKETVIHACD